MTEQRLDEKPARTSRLDWVDIAKGIAIFLVVFHHSIRFLQSQGWDLGPWVTLNLALQTFRMPLFFAAAGLFFFRNLATPWRRYMTGKALPFLYLYVLWSLIGGIVYTPFADRFDDGHPIRNALLALSWPTNYLWYIYGLFFYFVVVKAMQQAKIPPAVQVAGAAVLGAAFGSSAISTGSWTWDNVLTYFVFFVAAVHFRDAIASFTAKATWPRVIAACLLWGALVGVTFKLGLGINNWVRIPLSAVAVAFGFVLSAQLAKTALSGLLTYLGQRTLPIYLMHGFGRFLTWALPVSASMAVGLAAPVAVAVALTALSLGLWYALRWIPGLHSAPWLSTGRHR